MTLLHHYNELPELRQIGELVGKVFGVVAIPTRICAQVGCARRAIITAVIVSMDEQQVI